MLLSATTQSIRAVLAGAPATTQPVITASYVDNASGANTPSTTLTTMNGTTPVVPVAAPSSGHNVQIYEMSLWNADTAAITASITYYNGSTDFIIRKVTLQAGESLVYSKSLGWMMFDATGNIKQSLGGTTANITDISSGSWTPGIAGDIGAGTPTYSVQDGHYMKIGSMILITFEVVWTAFTGATGNFVLTGLPFVATGTNSQPGFLSQYGGINYGSGFTQLGVRIDNGASRGQFIANENNANAGFVAVSGVGGSGNLVGGALYR